MPADVPALRWGFVGTGGIANLIAPHITTTPLARLTASSSRTMSSARVFADRHCIALAFDDWKELCASDQVDAVYVATPTGVREEISTYAARAGKHVLAEKPFASAKSVRRIVAACRDSDVAFMDGTHFVHHPRTRMLKREALMNTGKPLSLDSAFQFALPDRGNIRYKPELEPMGAIGDAGWYNMRAAIEYLNPEAAARSVDAVVRRDDASGAIIAGAGVIQFDDGSTTTWNCGFDTGASVMTLRVTGPDGVISLDNFLHEDADHSASYYYRKAGSEPHAGQELRRIESHQSSVAAMFETFAAIAADAALRNDYATATLRTQTLLDACWESSKLK